MPTTLGIEIGINMGDLIGNIDINNINQINSEKDLIKYLRKFNINKENEYWKSVVGFIIYYRGAKFKTKQFEKECKFRNRESARKIINKLIKIDLIKRVKKGLYKILFDFK